VTGVEQWVPFDVQADASEYVAFVGYESGASDTDRTIPAKGKYAIVWRNGDKGVTIGWADPARLEPLQVSLEELHAMAEDLRAISSAQPASSVASPEEQALKPQGLVTGVTNLVNRCHLARLLAAVDTVATAAAGISTVAGCISAAASAGALALVCGGLAGVTGLGVQATTLMYKEVANRCQYQYPTSG
jgi:hypothetical protein